MSGYIGEKVTVLRKRYGNNKQGKRKVVVCGGDQFYRGCVALRRPLVTRHFAASFGHASKSLHVKVNQRGLRTYGVRP